MQFAAGQQIGPYQVDSKIGAGGMGEVYRATDTRLGRAVALKILPSHLSESPELRQRLEREAKVISSLSHPNICGLYDVGQHEGAYYLVMEYLEGETLASRLDRGPLPPDQVLRYGIEIAEAIDKAHRQGVVHRDLKPGNVILTKGGAKLLDFGLAAVRQAPPGSIAMSMTGYPTGAAPLTAEGTILGTFQYMAPEQIEGQEADARTDIFALGLVLYEMATGRRAFEGKTQASLIAAILRGEPQPMAQIEPLTSPALERIVQVCLAKDPDQRWQTAHDVALQLRWVEEGGSVAGIPAPVAARRRSRERIAWIAAAVFGVVAASLGARALLEAPPPVPPVVRFQIQPEPSWTSSGSPRLSPDGRFVAFDAVDSVGVSRIWVRPLDALQARVLPGTERAGRPFWSPDSRFVAYIVQNTLRKVDVTGAPPVLVGDLGSAFDGTWGSKDVILFDASTGDSIRAVPASGGNVTPASRLDREAGESGHGWPQFLPDGEHFLFLAFGRPEGPVIKVGRLGSLESKVLTGCDTRMDFTLPNHLLLVRDGTLLDQPFDPKTQKLTGDPFPIAEAIGVGGTGLAHYSVSQTGALLYRGGRVTAEELVWLDRTGRELQVATEEGRYDSPDLSPDGRSLVMSLATTGQGSLGNVWVRDLVRGVQTRLSFEGGAEWDATWSADGTHVAYTADDGKYVMRRRVGGSGPPDTLYRSPTQTFGLDWSPDGRTIFAAQRGNKNMWDVVALHLEDSTRMEPIAATEFIEGHPQISPDGKWLVYTSNESGRSEIYVQGWPGGTRRWQVSTAGGREAAWGGNGREIYYLNPEWALMSVSVAPQGGHLELGVPEKLYDLPSRRNVDTRNHYVPSPDGRRFLVVRPKVDQNVNPTTVVLNWPSAFERAGQ